MSKMHTEEYLKSMIDFAYTCAFRDALRTAHRVLQLLNPSPLRIIELSLEGVLDDFIGGLNLSI